MQPLVEAKVPSRLCICLYIQLCACMYIYIHACLHICMWVHTCVSMAKKGFLFSVHHACFIHLYLKA